MPNNPVWQESGVQRPESPAKDARGTPSDQDRDPDELPRVKGIAQPLPFLEQIINCIADPIFVKDHEHRLVLVNDAECALAGRSRDELLGRIDHDAVPAGQQEVLCQHDGGVIETGQECASEDEIADAQGRARTVITRKTRFVDGAGNRFVVGVIRDITGRKRTEETLRKSEERFRRFFEHNVAGAYISTVDGRLLACNSAFVRMFGYASVEAALDADARMLYPDANGRDVFVQLLRTHGSIARREDTFRRVDGTPVHVIETAVGVFDQRGELSETHGYLIDDTENRKAQEQLRLGQRMEVVGRLTGGIAHDFNNLLTVIRGYSQVLLAQMPCDSSVRDGLLEIGKAADRATTLTRQLLAFGRKQVLNPQVLDLKALVADMDKLLRRLLSEDVRLITEVDADLGAVRADPGQIERVIVNLVVNARDAMPEGGTVTIEIRNVELDSTYVASNTRGKSGRYVLLAVSDTGMGMSDETKSHMFDPFFTTKDKGTGLGLATVYGIVMQSEGYIWAYSEIGHGTTIKTYLPRVEETAQPVVGPRIALPARGSETVLVVEDEPGIRSFVRETLRSYGYVVREAEAGEAAIALARQRSVSLDLILSDVVLPGMSGPMLCEELVRIRPGLRVLYMSGYSEEAIAQRGKSRRVAPLLEKPFTPDALALRVREVLDAPVEPRLDEAA